MTPRAVQTAAAPLMQTPDVNAYTLSPRALNLRTLRAALSPGSVFDYDRGYTDPPAPPPVASTILDLN